MTIDKAEIWKDIPEFEGMYQVSDQGNVRSLARKIITRAGVVRTVYGRHLKTGLYDGYRQVKLYKGGVESTPKMAFLVLLAFVGKRPLAFDVAHENGIRCDDRLDNLKYKSRKENNEQKIEHGTMTRGSLHPLAKLTERDVVAILQSAESQQTLASRYGVDPSLISNIKRGKKWRHVSPEGRGMRNGSRS